MVNWESPREVKVVQGIDVTRRGVLTIPDTVVHNGKKYAVAEIGAKAFVGLTEGTVTQFRNVVLPNTVRTINESAFAGCTNIEVLQLPDNITGLGYSAFKDCASLKTIHMPSKLSTIGQECFKGCRRLETIDVPASVLDIKAGAFDGCTALKKLSFKGGTPPQSMGLDAFDGLNKDCIIEIPDGTRDVYMTNAAFAIYATQVFETDDLIPSATLVVDSVAENAFQGDNTYNITKLTVSKGIEKIGKQAFHACDSLFDLHLLGTEPDKLAWGDEIVADTTRLHVPFETLAAYGKKLTGYSEQFYSDYTIAEDGVSMFSIDCNAQVVGDATAWVVCTDTLVNLRTGGYGISAVLVPDSIIADSTGVLLRAMGTERNILLRHTTQKADTLFYDNLIAPNLAKQKAGSPAEGRRYAIADGVWKTIDKDTELDAFNGYLDITDAQAPERLQLLWEWDGDGSENNPYLIYIALQMDALAKRVNTMGNNYEGKTFRLMRDVDFGGTATATNGTNYTPIGTNKYGIDLTGITVTVDDSNGVIKDVTVGIKLPEVFQATFDGNGHTVSGVCVKRTGTNAGIDCLVGLFGWMGANSTVKNLTLSNSSFAGFNYVGGMAGLNSGTIENCHVEGSVVIDNYQDKAYAHGTVAGYNDGGQAKVSGCTSSGCLAYNNDDIFIDNNFFGGMVGHNRGTIENCIFIGKGSRNEGVIASRLNKKTGTCTNNFYTVENVINTFGGIFCEGYDEKPDSIGDPVKTYGKDDYEGITAYQEGLYFKGKYYYIPTIYLIEGEDNSEILAEYNGKYVNVKYDRVLSATQKDGKWVSKAFTICLPYNLEISEHLSEGGTANLYTLWNVKQEENGKQNSGNNELIFTNVYDHIYPGHPYIVVVKQGTLTLNAKNVKIDTEIKSDKVWKEESHAENNEEVGEPIGYWTGTFVPLSNDECVEKHAYLIQNNGSFRRVSNEKEKYRSVHISSFRAFFSLTDVPFYNGYWMKFEWHDKGLGGDNPDESVIEDFPSTNFESDGDIDFDDEPDAILIRTIERDGSSQYFDLQGRPLNGKPNRGAYIYNGNKYLNK